MTKIDAVAFSWAGDKYIGRSYEEMDCQAFVEKCMADVGLRMDLGGSNSCYRGKSCPRGRGSGFRRQWGEVRTEKAPRRVPGMGSQGNSGFSCKRLP